MSVAPPKTKQFTADNVTGANIVSVSRCTRIFVQDVADNPTLDSTITLQSGDVITRQPGFRYYFKAQPGGYFDTGQVIGIIKAATAGTITFGQEEY